jgi:hypothetical protein
MTADATSADRPLMADDPVQGRPSRLTRVAVDSYALLAAFVVLAVGALAGLGASVGAAASVAALIAGWSSSWSP